VGKIRRRTPARVKLQYGLSFQNFAMPILPKPTKYKFDPEDYPEYEHIMTHQDESRIEDYSKFSTWEFKL
jgi:hypothetical protein